MMSAWFRRVGVTLAIGTIGTVAFAHGTGKEKRSGPECATLSNAGDVEHCKACVAKNGTAGAEKMHYHPDYPEGERCRPDNGKP